MHNLTFEKIKKYFSIPVKAKLKISQNNIKHCLISSVLIILCELFFLSLEFIVKPAYNLENVIYYCVFISGCFILIIVSCIFEKKNNYYLNQTIVILGCTFVCFLMYFNIFESLKLSYVLTYYFSIFMMIIAFDLNPLFYTLSILIFFVEMLVLDLPSPDFELNLHINNGIFCSGLIFFSFYKRRLICQREMYKLEIEEKNRKLSVQNIDLQNQKDSLLVNKHNLEDAVLNQSQELQLQKENIIRIQDNTIVGLSNLIENRDGDTGAHVLRTRDYVQLIATKAYLTGNYPELNEETIKLYIKAAPMHDIGKIVVPDAVLQKPGKLTPEEFEIIKLHTIKGEKIIDDVLKFGEENYRKVTKDISTLHHEKFDGTGYPYGLKGKNIPLSARIMAIADVFDALISPRCYKEPFSLDKAFDIIKESAGTHFDPELTEIFLASKNEIMEILERYN